MKQVLFLIASLYLFSSTGLAASQPFSKELEIFAPFVGTWEAVFKTENGKPTVTDISKWERALNGKALRTLHSVNEGQYGGESLIFFDKSKQQIVFYYFTTADFHTQGVIEVTGKNSFVAYEDVTGNQDGITKVKSTSTLSQGKMTVSTSYLKKGNWTASEQRTYKPSSKQVIFK